MCEYNGAKKIARIWNTRSEKKREAQWNVIDKAAKSSFAIVVNLLEARCFSQEKHLQK